MTEALSAIGTLVFSLENMTQLINSYDSTKSFVISGSQMILTMLILKCLYYCLSVFYGAVLTFSNIITDSFTGPWTVGVDVFYIKISLKANVFGNYSTGAPQGKEYICEISWLAFHGYEMEATLLYYLSVFRIEKGRKDGYQLVLHTAAQTGLEREQHVI